MSRAKRTPILISGLIISLVADTKSKRIYFREARETGHEALASV